jgi:hypothetical protein
MDEDDHFIESFNLIRLFGQAITEFLNKHKFSIKILQLILFNNF